ncbi:response regulator [Puia sp.]|jgi:CheY-like chemotaxis protein|uniref:response regulator n=1 Tax=Puia sp. TaxID=2045100 RepID=UPI002F40536F
MAIKTIFLADDDKDDLDMLSAVLSELMPGSLIRTFLDGTELVMHLAAHPDQQAPQLMILDYKMPLMDGPAVLNRLQSTHHAFIPAFILSTSQEERDKARCLQAGASGYFSKPTNYGELKFIILEIMRRCEAGGHHSNRK